MYTQNRLEISQVKLWQVVDTDTPATLLCTLNGHSSKVVLMSYHPAISGLLATCDVMGTLILWDTHQQVKVQNNFLI